MSLSYVHPSISWIFLGLYNGAGLSLASESIPFLTVFSSISNNNEGIPALLK